VRQTARAPGLSNGGGLRYLRAEHCPNWGPGQPRPTQLDALAARAPAPPQRRRQGRRPGMIDYYADS